MSLPSKSLCVLLTITLTHATLESGMHEQSEHHGRPSNEPSPKTIAAPGLNAPVDIEFDSHHVPTIQGTCLDDAAFAQGYLHAHDRMFQMDGMRRLAAGELAEAFGPAVLELDEQYRPYRFRHVAKQVVESLDDETHRMLERYAAGVNYAMTSWENPPFEYITLNLAPTEWKLEDSVLVMLMMFDMLHIEGQLERHAGVMRDTLPHELVQFLTPTQSRFDALLIGGEPGSNDWEPMPIPGPDVVDVRGRAEATNVEALVSGEPLALGSNNWAVAGQRTKDGRAILANDPHLPHQIPPIWYRIELHWDENELERALSGLSLPGLPGIVIGSNGYLAWGFTNSMYDFQDLIVIEVDDDDPSRYRTPDGYESFGKVVEEIRVRGRGSERLTLRTTRWGVVTGRDHQDRPLVKKWTALDPEMVNLDVLEIVRARTIEEGVEAFRHSRGPSQNVLLACENGRIAWVVSGTIPKRTGFDGSYPVSWADEGVGWAGAIDEEDRPVLIDPPGGILFTANNRTISRERARDLGGIWAAGTRARRIYDMLQDARNVDESDMFMMQLDTRVAMLDFYAELAREGLAYFDKAHELDAEDRERLDASRAVLDSWDGTAAGDQAAVRLLNTLRRLLHQRVIGQLVAPCRDVDPRFRYRWFMEEEPMRRILEERPAHFLPRGSDDWSAVIARSWRDTLRSIEQRGGDDWIEMRWDESNRLSVQHPLAQVVPMLGRRLRLPDDPQPGHSHAVRVATPTFGASARMVVSPGREDEGILHLPGGQTGDPQSPHFSGTYDAWLHGRPVPFRPGEMMEQRRLVPTE